jgi:ketosteroid isomerase-like protein
MSVQDANTVTHNTAVVRLGYEALNAADVRALTELFDEGASWHTPGRDPLAVDQQGREATFAQFGRYAGEREARSRPSCSAC